MSDDDSAVMEPEVMHRAGSIMRDQQARDHQGEAGKDSLSHDSHDDIAGQFSSVRQATEQLCLPLALEDYGLQAMAEVSPPKWHLAHTSWFFETFILKPFVPSYRVFHPRFEILFNSYYNGIGEQYPRARRGLLSRPTVSEVMDYRRHIDEAVLQLLADTGHASRDDIRQRCELGINHEQQHQELICTDIKYSFSFNPLYPSIDPSIHPSINSSLDSSHAEPEAGNRSGAVSAGYIDFDGCETMAGFEGDGFHFDNESPRHPYILQPYRLAERVVNNAEYRAFIEDGGYRQANLWLSDGWMWVKQNGISQPLYWRRDTDGHDESGGDGWYEYTLSGLVPLDDQLPACHLNYYEADAFARWMGKRLPSEFEWEHACSFSAAVPDSSRIYLHPVSAPDAPLRDMFGSVWQWTSSSYGSYPGYRPAEGAIGEYNGKFMSNQMVLRGSSCVTPPGHARPSYRNFFYPVDRWQYSGIRLADDGA